MTLYLALVFALLLFMHAAITGRIAPKYVWMTLAGALTVAIAAWLGSQIGQLLRR